MLHDGVIPGHPAGHNRLGAGHCFEDGVGHSFIKGGVNEAVAGPTNLAQLFALEPAVRSEEHTSELQSQSNLVCRLLLEKKNGQWILLAILPSFAFAIATVMPSRVAAAILTGLLAAAGLIFFDLTELTIVLGDIVLIASRTVSVAVGLELMVRIIALVIRSMTEADTGSGRTQVLGLVIAVEFFFLMMRLPPRSTLFPYTTLFRSDLATIVAKAMEREPAARYRTAQELAEDLRRFQTGQIVSAHRYSPIELLRRFLRRYRAPQIGRAHV